MAVSELQLLHLRPRACLFASGVIFLCVIKEDATSNLKDGYACFLFVLNVILAIFGMQWDLLIVMVSIIPKYSASMTYQ